MPQNINRTMTPGEWGLLLFLAILWAGSYLYNALALAEVPPFSVVAFRVGMGALVLYVALRFAGSRMPTSPKVWGAFAVMGLINSAIPFSLIAWSQTTIPSGLASILNATTPLFTVLAAHLLTRDEHMTRARLTGVVIGLAGVTVLIGADALAHAGDHLLAEVACLSGSMLYALSAIYGRKLARMGIPPMVAATGQITAAAFIVVPLALLLEHPWTLAMPGPAAWSGLFGLAVLSTGVAYIVFYRILATAGSVNLMLVTFLVPVGAVLLGAIVLGERLSLNHFIGMAFIGTGLALIDGRVLRLLPWRRAGRT